MRLGTVADLDQTSSEMARIWFGSVRDFVGQLLLRSLSDYGELTRASFSGSSFSEKQ